MRTGLSTYPDQEPNCTDKEAKAKRKPGAGCDIPPHIRSTKTAKASCFVRAYETVCKFNLCKQPGRRYLIYLYQIAPPRHCPGAPCADDILYPIFFTKTSVIMEKSVFFAPPAYSLYKTIVCTCDFTYPPHYCVFLCATSLSHNRNYHAVIQNTLILPIFNFTGSNSPALILRRLLKTVLLFIYV